MRGLCLFVLMSKIKIPRRGLLYLLSLCLYKDNRAKYGLRGFMPRNIITPYECRRHEVQGSRLPNRHRRLKDAKVTKSRLPDDCTRIVTIPRTSPLAMLVCSYGVIHSCSLRSYDPCFARPICLVRGYIYKTTHGAEASVGGYCMMCVLD